VERKVWGHVANAFLVESALLEWFGGLASLKHYGTMALALLVILFSLPQPIFTLNARADY